MAGREVAVRWDISPNHPTLPAPGSSTTGMGAARRPADLVCRSLACSSMQLTVIRNIRHAAACVATAPIPLASDLA